MTDNVNHLTIGAAELYFAEGEAACQPSTPMADPTSFGNIVTSEISPDITYVDHYVSQKGSKNKDKSVAVTKTLTIPFTFDELSPENVRKFMLGGDLNASKTVVMDEESYEGRAILNFQTGVGQNFVYAVPKCTLKPDGALTTNVDDWMQANFVLEVLYHDEYRINNTGSLAPYGFMDFDAVAIGSPF
jgi:hypothetical protein